MDIMDEMASDEPHRHSSPVRGTKKPSSGSLRLNKTEEPHHFHGGLQFGGLVFQFALDLAEQVYGFKGGEGVYVYLG